MSVCLSVCLSVCVQPIYVPAIRLIPVAGMLMQVGVDILGEEGALVLRSTGSVVKFPGFLAIYGVVEEPDENTEPSDDEDGQVAGNGKVTTSLRLYKYFPLLPRGLLVRH